MAWSGSRVVVDVTVDRLLELGANCTDVGHGDESWVVLNDSEGQRVLCALVA